MKPARWSELRPGDKVAFDTDDGRSFKGIILLIDGSRMEFEDQDGRPPQNLFKIFREEVVAATIEKRDTLPPVSGSD